MLECYLQLSGRRILVVSMRREAKRNAVDRAMADAICRNAPLSVQGCLVAVNGLARAADADGWAATRQAGSRLPGSEDLAEGVRAFLEKRPPRWTGR